MRCWISVNLPSHSAAGRPNGLSGSVELMSWALDILHSRVNGTAVLLVCLSDAVGKKKIRLLICLHGLVQIIDVFTCFSRRLMAVLRIAVDHLENVSILCKVVRCCS